MSAQSTLRRPAKRSVVSNTAQPISTPVDVPSISISTSASASVINSNADYTVVVFSFCDEKFPYRTKIPGSMITLKQFKEILPKKGMYR